MYTLLTRLFVLVTLTLGQVQTEEQKHNPEPAHIAVFEHFAAYHSIKGFFHVAVPLDFASFHDACSKFRLALKHFQDQHKEKERQLSGPALINYRLLRDQYLLISLQTELEATCADVESWPSPGSDMKPETNRLNMSGLQAKKKRSVHIIAMKMLKFAGTSLGYFGLSYLWEKLIGGDDAKILNLETKVKELSHDVHGLLVKVNELVKLANTTIGTYLAVRKIQNFGITVNRFSAQVQAINLLWATLITSSRLSPNFARPGILQAFYSQIEDMLQDRNQLLVLDSPYQLLELPVSVLHKDDQTFVLIHIPLVDKKMDLHRLVPLPLWLKNEGGKTMKS